MYLKLYSFVCIQHASSDKSDFALELCNALQRSTECNINIFAKVILVGIAVV